MTLMSAALIVPFIPVLFLGWSSASARTSFGSVIGVPMLALIFSANIGIILFLTISCNVLLTWPRSSTGAPVDEPGSDTMRRALETTLFGRILFGKSDRD